MPYIADLHLHSHYSRATSKNLNLETLYQWARIKGIHVIGTGDFTHPAWFKELKEKLEPDGTGFFRLKNPPKDPAVPGIKVHDIDVRFCLTTEISSIYKFGDKVRKNHNLLFAPGLETVSRISARLATIGNLKADGRPILGLPSRDLLEIVLESSDQAHLIPAHVWTPWFSTLGSKGGYDSIEACFRDLTDHIFALETGLSSDPEMNWKWSALDRFTLISNSDAHSPQKLGREANLFDTEKSYEAMFSAIKTQEGFLGTYEFFPEEGKYHHDGHRKCNVSLEPRDALKYKNLCPVCGKPMTLGVLHQVEKLSDRKEPQRPAGAADFDYIIPLPEIIAEIKGVGPNSKTVQKRFHQTISAFGNEFTLLKKAPIEDIGRQCGPVLAEAIRRMRTREVRPEAGYDGIFGVIKIFDKGEIEKLTGQLHFFGAEEKTAKKRKTTSTHLLKNTFREEGATYSTIKLNDEQQAVQLATKGAILVKAGPGTGKTRTLIHWIENQIEKELAKPSETLAITFTNKAADELKERLSKSLGDQVRHMHIGTFHAIGYHILQERYPNLGTVYGEEDRKAVLGFLFPKMKSSEVNKLAKAFSRFFELMEIPDGLDNFENNIEKYRTYLLEHGAVDLSDIIQSVLNLWKSEPVWLEKYRAQWQVIAADEFQDINPLQYEFLKMLGENKTMLAIGDPDQAIYGFRGSDVRLFFQFEKAFQAQALPLSQNYRSTKTIIKAASGVIRNNTLKSGISLKSMKLVGEKIQLFQAQTPEKEAQYILEQILQYVGGTDNLTVGSPETGGDYAFSDIAILYRSHFVGEALLSKLKKAGIPIHLSDGSSMLEQPPFSMIAHILRLFGNPSDIMALHGVLKQALSWAQKDIREFLAQLHQGQTDWREGSVPAISAPAFEQIEQWRIFYKNLSDALKQNGVEGMLLAIFNSYLPDSQLNESQLLQKEVLLQFARDAQADVDVFLKTMLLNPYTDAGRQRAQGVHLLTFHASKGLEFPVVFIAGAEEGITPVQRFDTDLEEERRLFYVAMTRAKEELQLTYVKERRQWGKEIGGRLSRFVGEIPQELMALVKPKEKKVVKKNESQLLLFK